MRSTSDAQKFSNISASPAPFPLFGGCYALSVVATWGDGGTVALRGLGPDGSTFLDVVKPYDVSAAEQNEPVNTLNANGILNINVPPGEYQLTITTATAVYASVVRVPVSE